MKLTSNLKEYIYSLCYSKKEVDEAIGNITQFDYKMVSELPASGVKGTIYMLQNANEDSDNLFDGYLWVNNRWELVGPRIDLSNYYVKSDVDSLLDDKVDFSDVVTSTRNGLMTPTMRNKLNNIEEEADKTTVTPISFSDGKKVKIGTVNGTELFVPVDDLLDDNSVNPVQNKVVDTVVSNLQNEVYGKANAVHTHTKSDITNLVVASSVSDGLMSIDDKVKLDGISAGANKIIVDTALNASSSNPLANKTIVGELNKKAGTNHDHDDSYYLKTQVDTALNGKSNTNHNHDSRYYTETETDELLNAKSDTSHNHDSRYYTESEMNTKLNGKSDTGHTHDDRYYTETEINTKMNGKSDAEHTHDARYYLKSEVDSIEEALQSTINNLIGFTAEVVPSLPATGEEGVMYLVLSESGVNQDIYNEYIYVNNSFEKIGNTAVEVDLSGYATINFVNSTLADYVTSAGLTTALETKANTSHDHDERYYTESEVNTKLNGKSDTDHNHDSRYYTESEMDTKLAGKASTSLASSSANGLMSSGDKGKLDGVATGANKTVVDSSMSSSSTNPVQNKIVYQELANKANTSHNHDDKYYTESEIDSKLSTKSNTDHTHDTLYYTESEIDTKLNGKASSSHNHDSRYYTETETDNLLTDYYTMVEMDELLLDNYYTGVDVDDLLSSKSDDGHIHDGRYYTESEMNTKLAGKSDTSHTHNRLDYTAIPAGADLNNYKTPGMYMDDSWYDISSMKNVPLNWSFILEVETTEGDLVLQTFHAIGSSNCKTLRRVYHRTGGWSEWIEYYNSKNISYSTSDLTTNFHTCRVGQVGIVSWWARVLNASQKDTWTPFYTLPFTNMGKTVWTSNVANTTATLYLRVKETSNVLEYRSSISGNVPLHPGQLVMFANTTL